MKAESQKEFINRKRLEIKTELTHYLKKVDHLLTTDDIINEVLHDDNDEDFESFVFLLAQDTMDSDPEQAQELAMELFNYFPRKTLGGKSLAENMSFTELKKMEKSFQNFKNGTADVDYTYTLPDELTDFRMTMRVPNKNDLYYDAMEALGIGDYKNAEKLLRQALSLDPDYVQTHLAFAYLYHDLGQREKADNCIRIAFEKIKKEFPKWPKEMPWGVLENRAYLRVIEKMAERYYDDGKIDKTEELYRLLLKLNPNDNQGVRYVLAGLYAGISGDQINKMTDEGNARQNWDKLEKLVAVQNKKHRFWKEPKE